MKEIARYLKDCGLIKNNKELSKKLGVSEKTMSDWTTGKYFPTLDKVLALSKIYEIEITVKNGKLICSEINSTGQTENSMYRIVDKVTDTNSVLANSNHTLANSTNTLASSTKTLAEANKSLSGSTENLTSANRENQSAYIKLTEKMESILTSKKAKC